MSTTAMKTIDHRIGGSEHAGGVDAHARRSANPATGAAAGRGRCSPTPADVDAAVAGRARPRSTTWGDVVADAAARA